jgi:hypothetical protein
VLADPESSLPVIEEVDQESDDPDTIAQVPPRHGVLDDLGNQSLEVSNNDCGAVPKATQHGQRTTRSGSPVLAPNRMDL